MAESSAVPRMATALPHWTATDTHCRMYWQESWSEVVACVLFLIVFSVSSHTSTAVILTHLNSTHSVSHTTTKEGSSQLLKHLVKSNLWLVASVRTTSYCIYQCVWFFYHLPIKQFNLPHFTTTGGLMVCVCGRCIL